MFSQRTLIALSESLAKHGPPRPRPHRCPFADCTELAFPTAFCCMRHWKALMPAQRQRIYIQYQLWRSGKFSHPEMLRRQRLIAGISEPAGETVRGDCPRETA